MDHQYQLESLLFVTMDHRIYFLKNCISYFKIFTFLFIYLCVSERGGRKRKSSRAWVHVCKTCWSHVGCEDWTCTWLCVGMQVCRQVCIYVLWCPVQKSVVFYCSQTHFETRTFMNLGTYLARVPGKWTPGTYCWSPFPNLDTWCHTPLFTWFLGNPNSGL